VIFNHNEAFHFSDGRFSPFSEQSNLSSAARISLPPNKVIYCFPDNEGKFSKCFIDGRWQSFSLSGGSLLGKFVSTAAREANGMVCLITEGGRLARAENRRVTRVYDQRDGLPKYPLNLMTAARFAR
jgi:hypothetical protein